MKVSRILAAVLVGAAFATAPAPAAVTSSFSFPVAKAPHPLPLDPSLSDPAWAAGAVPNGDGPWANVTTRGPAEFATKAYLLYDDHNLYVAFQASQSGARTVATQTTNDVGFGIDDFVGVGLETGSGGQAYFFETTPRGVRYEQSNENVRFRPRWQAAAHTEPGGWNAVMIIPLSVLKYSAGQAWHLEFVRLVAAKGEHYVWAFNGIMQDVGQNGTWPTFNDVRFWASANVKVADPRSEGRADVYGLLSGGGDRDVFTTPTGTTYTTKVRSFGIDASFPITPTISFVGTANPDFSNVEIDQQTITPQEFRRQLTEYRPFFAQGAPFVNASSGNRTPIGPYSTATNYVFYSPSIGPFDWGTQMEGTFGDQSFGALAFRGFDQTTGNTFSDEAYGYEHAIPNGTFYYWSDGVLAHHSIAGDDNTVETGMEGRNYKSGLVWLVDHAFENGSWVPQGHADETELFADVHRPNYEINAGYMGISPNYDPIDGYTSNSDIHGPQVNFNLFGSLPEVKNWSLVTVFDRFLDNSGAVHQADTQLFLNATFKDGFSLDGVGSQVGQLRSYGIPAGPGCSGPIVAQSSFTGYPCYRDGVTSPFDLYQIPIGYGDGTPKPIDAQYSWGPFGPNYAHLFTLTTTRPLTKLMTLGLTYDGTWERPFKTGELTSQWLRSVSLGINLTQDSTLTFALRNISGYGGFATQIGNNLAIAYHQHFTSGDELYINYGSPAAGATINRLIVKFVFHAGADSGT
jgi:hypothetical protein